jgi:NAD-dependent SIR2 family protein deacetylase
LVFQEFLCKICFKVFQQRGFRNRHQKGHYTEYGCKWCEKMYKRKEGLLDHVKTVHTQENGRPCPYCKKILRGKNLYYYHIKKCARK